MTAARPIHPAARAAPIAWLSVLLVLVVPQVSIPKRTPHLAEHVRAIAIAGALGKTIPTSPFTLTQTNTRDLVITSQGKPLRAANPGPVLVQAAIRFGDRIARVSMIHVGTGWKLLSLSELSRGKRPAPKQRFRTFEGRVAVLMTGLHGRPTRAAQQRVWYGAADEKACVAMGGAFSTLCRKFGQLAKQARSKIPSWSKRNPDRAIYGFAEVGLMVADAKDALHYVEVDIQEQNRRFAITRIKVKQLKHAR